MAATIDIVAKFSDQASAGVQALTQTVTASQQQMTRMGEAAGTAGRAGVQDLLNQIGSLRTRLGELSGATKAPEDALGSLVGTIGRLGGSIAGMIPTISIWAAAITAAVVVFREAITALAEWSVATEKTTVNLKALGVTEEEGKRLVKEWGDGHKRAAEAAKDYASAVEYAAKAADERAVAEARASGNRVALIDAELQKKREAIEREKQDRIKAGEDRVLIEQGAHDKILAADLEAAGKRQKALDDLKKAQTEAAQARVAAATKASGNILEVIRVELAETLAAIETEKAARLKAGDERAAVERIAADKRIAAETEVATKTAAAMKPHLDAAIKAAEERALAEAKASGDRLRVIAEETRQKLAAIEREKADRTKALGDSVLAEKIAADQRAAAYAEGAQKQREAVAQAEKAAADERAKAVRDAARAEAEAARQAEQARKALVQLDREALVAVRARSAAEAQAARDVVAAIATELAGKQALIQQEEQERLAALERLTLTEQQQAEARLQIQQTTLDKMVAAEIEAADKRRRAAEEATRGALDIFKELGAGFEDITKQLTISKAADEMNAKMAELKTAFDLGRISADQYARGIQGLQQFFQKTAEAAEAGASEIKEFGEIAKGTVSAVRDATGKAVEEITGEIISFAGIMTQEAKNRLAEVQRIQRIEAAEAKIRRAEFQQELVERERALGFRSVSQEEVRRREEATNVNVNVNAGRLAQGITVEQERQTQRRATGSSGMYWDPITRQYVYY
jgi:hypothetical protein